MSESLKIISHLSVYFWPGAYGASALCSVNACVDYSPHSGNRGSPCVYVARCLPLCSLPLSPQMQCYSNRKQCAVCLSSCSTGGQSGQYMAAGLFLITCHCYTVSGNYVARWSEGCFGGLMKPLAWTLLLLMELQQFPVASWFGAQGLDLNTFSSSNYWKVWCFWG